MTKSVKSIAFDLEHPIFEARSLAHALMMMASSGELRGESGQAVAAVASTLLGHLETIKGGWEAILDATQGKTASKGAVKKRALRVVDGSSRSCERR
jgi:hypothetical protein